MMAQHLTPPENDPDPRWLEQWVENQKQELELRAKELELAKQQDVHNIEYARLSLKAQAEDRKDERECSRSRAKDRYWLLFGLVVVVAGLLGVAMYTGRDALALELVKLIGYTMVGAIGGYGYASRRSSQSHNIGDDQ